MNNTKQAADYYKQNGFRPFVLAANSKKPLENVPLHRVERIGFPNNHNIGIFAGSMNGLVVIDADEDKTQEYVLRKLYDLGLTGWTTMVRTPTRKGLHLWLKVRNVPDHAQAYYKLDKSLVGSGELRVKFPAYVVAPPSVVEAGTYEFVQGSPALFHDQPILDWLSLDWVVPKKTLLMAGVDTSADVGTDGLAMLTRKVTRCDDPTVLQLLDDLRGSEEVHRINYRTGERLLQCFSTRSEAEAALMTGLVMAGWSFDEATALFEREQPGHYATVPRKARYLQATYNKAVAYVNRRG